MNGVIKYRVTSDYEKKDSNELTLKAGDFVEVLKKGNYLCYGKINNSKGFFPKRIITEIESTTSFYNGANLSTPTVDNTKHTIAQADKTSVSMSLEESFEKITHQPPLEDKHKTRTKSIGRPPSQLFIKGNILNRSNSTDILNTTTEANESENITATRLTQLKGNATIKTYMNSKNNDKEENPMGVPIWMKILPKRKSTASVSSAASNHKNENVKIMPLWMQEFRKKREHKLSLKGDETIEKIDQSVKTAHETIKFIRKTSTSNDVTEQATISQLNLSIQNIVKSTGVLITENKHLVQGSAESSVEMKDNQSKSSLKVNKEVKLSRSLTDIEKFSNDKVRLPTRNKTLETLIDLDKPPTDIKSISDMITANVKKTNKISLEKPTFGKEEPLVNLDKIINQGNNVYPAPTNMVSAGQTECMKNDTSNSNNYLNETISESIAIITNEPHVTSSTEGESSSNCTVSITTENVMHNDHEENTNSIRSLLKEFEEFNVKHDLLSIEIKQDIERLENNINQQREEVSKFIQKTKNQLHYLIESELNR